MSKYNYMELYPGKTTQIKRLASHPENESVGFRKLTFFIRVNKSTIKREKSKIIRERP